MAHPQDPAATRRELGFPEGAGFRHLAVSDAGGCLVAKVSVSTTPVPSEHLFVRAFNETTYREVPWPPNCNSFGDPLILVTKPEMYVLGEHWQNQGGGTEGLYRVTLPGGSIAFVHSGRGTHSSGTEREGGWWFADLLGSTSDEKGLIVSLATSFRESGGSRVEYTVAAFELDTGRLRELARLPAVFA
jgi:hypothetical protein